MAGKEARNACAGTAPAAMMRPVAAFWTWYTPGGGAAGFASNAWTPWFAIARVSTLDPGVEARQAAALTQNLFFPLDGTTCQVKGEVAGTIWPWPLEALAAMKLRVTSFWNVAVDAVALITTVHAWFAVLGVADCAVIVVADADAWTTACEPAVRVYTPLDLSTTACAQRLVPTRAARKAMAGMSSVLS